MDGSVIFIRRATERDHTAIRTLVRSERLNPSGLDWRNFLVASTEGCVVGAVQMRHHADGSRELGSLVVTPELRGRGIAGELIEALIGADAGPIWMITDEAFAGACRRWEFQPIAPATAPVRVRRNFRLGRLVGLVSIVKRRPRRRLVILERLPIRAAPPTAELRIQRALTSI